MDLATRQGWHFIVITDPALQAGLADLYRRSFAAYRGASAGDDLPAPANPV